MITTPDQPSCRERGQQASTVIQTSTEVKLIFLS